MTFSRLTLCLLLAASAAGCAPSMYTSAKAPNYSGTVSRVTVFIYDSADTRKTQGSGVFQKEAGEAIDSAFMVLRQGLSERLPASLAGIPASLGQMINGNPGRPGDGSSHLLVVSPVNAIAQCSPTRCKATVRINVTLLDARNGVAAWYGMLDVPDPDDGSAVKIGKLLVNTLRADGLLAAPGK